MDGECWKPGFSLLEREVTDKQGRSPEGSTGDGLELEKNQCKLMFSLILIQVDTYRNTVFIDMCMYTG